ncbi:MAG: bifunctional folylpolyglutamate synthase/dihydrofolate synthase [Chryseobacterium sp.]|nr:MAG: bifunctional folylpolyglutamate synthase/dihydrofolate synthase [Chryseobacterium sp.]
MQSYKEAIDWLFSQVPNYQLQGSSAYKPGLENIRSLAKSFGNSHLQFPSIHIAGTNGKGSTSHMLASILQEAGYKVGLFTSPHLVNFTERIKINGSQADQDFVLNFIERSQQLVQEIKPSFFEITTLLAFEYFAKENVDIAVIETGLGGRLDATNIISPEISVITSISYDHQDLLGNSLEEITIEKCGIIKEHIPVISGDDKISVQNIIRKQAELKQALFVDASTLEHSFRTSLLGNYQHQNTKTVIASVQQLRHLGWNISDENIQNGLQHIVQNTDLRGRWEILQKNPKIIADVGHNEAGFGYILEQLSHENAENIHMILGFVKGKDVAKIIQKLPKNYLYYFVQPAIPRALHPIEYEPILKENQLQYQLFSSVALGLESAKQTAKPDDVLFVGGSNFVVAEVI